MSAPNPVSHILLPSGERLDASTETAYMDALQQCADRGLQLCPVESQIAGRAWIVREMEESY